MVTIVDVLRQHGPAYLQRYGAAVPSSHVRAINALTRCGTGALGGHLAECKSCDKCHVLLNSCGHRMCPRCGWGATQRWLSRQRALLLPVRYYHVVFTLPAELRRVVRAHQEQLISVLFRAAYDALSALCGDPHFLGGSIGALAVLHTWTRTLEWHPHIHMLVPAGALAADGETWLTPPSRRKEYLVPHAALSAGFRGRFQKLARRAGIELPEVPKDKRWVVYAKPAVQGAERVLSYLGRYVHRTALSNKSLLSCDAESVTFSYRDSRDGQRKTMRLPGYEFLRRFLQHTPRKGLHRVRAFGLLHSAHRATLRRVQLLLGHTASAAEVDETEKKCRPSRCCPYCKQQTLRRVRRLSARQCIVYVVRLAKEEPIARAPPVAARGAA